jgi:pimeloyl-ACP methyl ester carboxylesterase
VAEIVQIGVQYLSGRYDFLESLEGQIRINFEERMLTFELSEKHARTRPIRLHFKDLIHFEPEIHGMIRKSLRISLGYQTRKPGPPDSFQVTDSWVKLEDIEGIRDRLYEYREEMDHSPSIKASTASSIQELVAGLERFGKSLLNEVAKATAGAAKAGEKLVRPPPPKPPAMERKFREIYISKLSLSVYDSAWEIGPYRRKGVPLVFIHGIGCAAWVWNHQLARFSRKRRTISYDLRGHGNSERPKSGYTTVDHSQDLTELLKALKITEQQIIIGHSIGGMVCLQHVLDNPAKISGLVLISAWGSFPPDIKRAAKLLPPPMTWGPLKGKARKMAPDFLLANPESYLSKLIVPRIEKTPDGVLSASIKGIIRKADFSNRLKELELPVLVIRGSEDKVFQKEDANLLIGELSNAQYAEIPRTGHFPPLERPMTTYRIISRFLKEIPENSGL